MQTNNAEIITEVENQTAVQADTTSTTEVNAIEADETATGEQSSSVESKEQPTTDSNLVYDIDGEEVPASTVAEWRKSTMLQADYTKKTQALANDRKGFEAESQEVKQTKEKLNDYISKLDALITKDSKPEDLAELRDTDPSEYLRRKEEIAEKQSLSEQAKKDLAEVNQAEELKRISKEQALLLEAMPEWKDAVRFKADTALIDEYAQERGFSDEDFNKLTSHKLMLMTLDAAKYNKLQKETANTEKQVDKAPNVVKARAKESTKLTTVAERFYGK